MEETTLNITFPHCDSAVLHKPGLCEYCDAYPERQALRVRWNINFTGENEPDKTKCPAEAKRPIEVIYKWGGNKPKIQPSGVFFALGTLQYALQDLDEARIALVIDPERVKGLIAEIKNAGDEVTYYAGQAKIVYGKFSIYLFKANEYSRLRGMRFKGAIIREKVNERFHMLLRMGMEGDNPLIIYV